MRLNARQLRASRPTRSDLAKIRRRGIYIICDNILDAYNIGSIFRLADAVAAAKIYLCGEMQTPPYHRIAKAAVGTEKWVPWEHKETAVEVIKELRERHSRPIRSETHGRRLDRESDIRPEDKVPRDPRVREDDSGKGIKVYAIEQGKESKDFRKVEFSEPVAFVVGHETTGVSMDAIKACDQLVEIPMFGVNRSLNVVLSLAIVLFNSTLVY